MSRSDVRRAIATLVAVTGAVLAVASGAAYAAPEQEDPGASGISQYVEMVPGAAGPKAPGITREKHAPLPRRAMKALESAPPATAELLKKVATSSSYGAPTQQATPIERSVEQTPVRTVAVGTTIEAIATTSDARLLGLLALVLAIAVSAIALAALKTRRE